MLIDADIWMGEIMKIVGAGTIKKAAKLEEGELCSLLHEGEQTLSIYLGKNDRFAVVGILSSGGSQGEIRNIEPSNTFYSYGKDWVVDTAANGFIAPSRATDGQNPCLFIDIDGPKISLLDRNMGQTAFLDLKSMRLSQTWPTMAVTFETFRIWQDENDMNRFGAKPLFLKEAPTPL